jgi:3-hydroxyisobutyrate dehydrogenase-like beta-hydroxyacid dehydrogenase
MHNQEGDPMLSSTETPSLETKTETWKRRAQAKQKWLEQALAKPTTSPRQAAQRMAWIKRALKMVKRAQSAIKYHTRLVDAYAQHLNALEMTLISEAEQKTGAKSAESEGRE